ncbi:hypothetical protein SAMN06298216_1348 [Spirosomataceae bacterium TFI 002]|nr:hypothetical protein SAMN06298216_1348 [Spirosomataceae bacterium TFI 002]
MIYSHPNYRITFLNEKSLREELKNWCREDLILWLKWNDPNGIYNDEESMEELGNIMTYEEGVEIIVKQVIQA